MKQTQTHIAGINFFLILKISAASALSWELAKLLGSKHPYLAPLSVILCLKPLLYETIQCSIYRFVGTVIGVIIVILVASDIPVNGWTLGMLILGGCLITHFLKLNKTVIEQVALSILLAFTLEEKSQYYPFDRILDTMIGVLLACIVAVSIYPTYYTKRAKQVSDQYRTRLTELFLDFSIWIQSGSHSKKGQQLEEQLKKDLQQIQTIEQDLYDTASIFIRVPFYKKIAKELNEYNRKTKNIKKGYSYLLNTVTTFQDWGSSGTMKMSDKVFWTNQMKTFSEMISEFQITLDPTIQQVETTFSNTQPQQFYGHLHQETMHYIHDFIQKESFSSK